MRLLNTTLKNKIKWLCLGFIALAGITVASAQEGPAAQRLREVMGDPYCLDSIDILYVKNPDLAIRRIDSLRKRCHANEWKGVSRPRLEMINALIYTYKENPAKTLYYCYEVLAQTEELNEENIFWRLMALQYMSLAYSSSENWYMTARTLHQMESLAKNRQRYLWYESVAQMIRSQMLTREGQPKKALEALDRAQEIMSRDTTKHGKINAFHNRLDTERFKAGINAEVGDLEQSREHYIKLLESLERADTTMCNKSLKELTQLRTYVMLCNLSEQMGQSKQAKMYYNKVTSLQCEYQEGHSITTPLSQYLLQSGQYNELEKMLTPILEQANKQSVITSQVATQMQAYIRMLHRSGRLKECVKWSERYMVLNDSLQQVAARRSMDEFEVAYQAKENEELVLRQKHELLMQKIWMVLLIISISLLAIGISLTYYLLCKHKRNNRFLFERIQETNAAFEQLTRLAIIPNMESSDLSTPTLSHEQITTRDVRNYLLEDGRYLDKHLQLDNVVRQSGLSVITLNKRLNSVIGMSLAEYVTLMRLDYACKLLWETNLTIDAVADDSGFNTTRTFLRQFKNKYNLSPTQYRKEKSGQKDGLRNRFSV